MIIAGFAHALGHKILEMWITAVSSHFFPFFPLSSCDSFSKMTRFYRLIWLRLTGALLLFRSNAIDVEIPLWNEHFSEIEPNSCKTDKEKCHKDEE